MSGERFDVRWNSWEEIPEMLTGRSGHELVTMDYSVYALGGVQSNADYRIRESLNTVEELEYHSQNWIDMVDMICTRNSFGAAVINGLPKLTFN